MKYAIIIITIIIIMWSSIGIIFLITNHTISARLQQAIVLTLAGNVAAGRLFLVAEKAE
jgi:hypothetical protein